MLSFRQYIIETAEDESENLYKRLFQAISGQNSTGRNHHLNPHEEYRPYVMTNYEEGYEPETDDDNPQTNKITWNNYHEAAYKIEGVEHMNRMFDANNNTTTLGRGDIWSNHAEMLYNLTQDESHPHYDPIIASLHKTIQNKFGHSEDEINEKILVNLFTPHQRYFNSVLPTNTPLPMTTLRSIGRHHMETIKKHPDVAYLEPFHPSVRHPDFDHNAPELLRL